MQRIYFVYLFHCMVSIDIYRCEKSETSATITSLDRIGGTSGNDAEGGGGVYSYGRGISEQV